MTSPYTVLKTKEKRAYDWLYVAAGAVAAYVFIAHGLEAIFQSASLLPVTRLVGLDDTTGVILLGVIGVVDIVIGVLLAVKPFRILLAYAALWVLVPLYLQYEATGELEIVAKVMLWVALAYYVFYASKKDATNPLATPHS